MIGGKRAVQSQGNKKIDMPLQQATQGQKSGTKGTHSWEHDENGCEQKPSRLWDIRTRSSAAA